MQDIYLIAGSLIRILYVIVRILSAFAKNPITRPLLIFLIILLLYTCGNTHKQPNLQSEEETKNGSIRGKIEEAVEEKRKLLEIE